MALDTTPRTTRVQVQLSAPLRRQLAHAARSCGVTEAAFIRVALERELALEKELAITCAPAGFDFEQER